MFGRVIFQSRKLTSFRQSAGFIHSTTMNPLRAIPGFQEVSTSSPKSKQHDIANVMNLEANLFENSAHQNSPVDTQTLLAHYKNDKKSKANKRNMFRKKGEIEHIETRPVDLPKRKSEKVKSIIIDNSSLGLPYTKLHLNDPWLHKLLLSVKSRRERNIKHQLLLEGRRLIVEAMSCGLTLDYILFSDVEQVKLIKDQLPSTTKLIKVPQSDLRFWSNLSTCPGLMGIFVKPLDMSNIWKPKLSTLPITVICDQIREPNNVGSIIRNCAAISCEQVILIKGCADPWESKALRGGAGGQFHVPIRGPIEWESVGNFLPKTDCFVYLAENNITSAKANIELDLHAEFIVPYDAVPYVDQHNVVIIGGETHGISADAYKLLKRNQLGKCIQIPLADEIDSLNSASALAVILFEIKKQIRQTR